MTSNALYGAMWGFLKNNWKAIALVGAFGCAFFWYKHRADASTAAAVAAMNAANQQEIATINQARATEEAQHQQEMQQLQDSLSQIQEQYQQAQAALVAQQAAEQAQIVKQYGNDPKGLATLLAGKMGFQVQ